jgi:hypothetical protein
MFVLDRVAKKSAMKALLCTRLGRPQSLVLTEGLPSPKPSAGEVSLQMLVGPVTDTQPGRRASLLERLVNLVVEIRATAGEGLDVDIARAVEEAFASIAREYRR